MVKSNWYTHPLFIFCFSIIALGSSLAIYISTYLEVHDAFTKFVKLNNSDATKLLDHSTWVTILVLSILFTLVTVGISLVYVYYKKVVQLYHMQQNFINGFTHELKTPVTSLKLFLDTLSMHELPREEQLKCLELMKRDTMRLSDNISQILDVAKIEDKKYPLDISKIYLNEFLVGILKKHAHIFERAEIKISGDKDQIIFGDYVLLEGLTMNILSNAVTYNDKDQTLIDINVKSIGSSVEVTFQDNGMGLVGADKKKIFKKFYRVKKAVKGSGIGLYMALQVAKLHAGSLKAESQGVGKGSLFTLTLERGSYAVK
jgi:signal transduction histidine kinase